MSYYRQNGSNVEILARGIRDTQGFDFDPQTGNIWFTDNGRDLWGDDRPPEFVFCAPQPILANELIFHYFVYKSELNYVAIKQSHFGFPFCYGKNLADPDWNMDGNCSAYVAPVQELEAHTAALGVKFYKGSMFPSQYANNVMFIAEHGSWNRYAKVDALVRTCLLKIALPVNLLSDIELLPSVLILTVALLSTFHLLKAG